MSNFPSVETKGAAVTNPEPVYLTKIWGREFWAKNRYDLAALGILLLLSLLAFTNTFGNGFVFDDKALIPKNKLIRSLENIPTFFATGYWAGARGDGSSTIPGLDLYRPLVLVTFALNYTAGGLNTFGYHLINLLLHTAVTAIFYALGRQLGYSWGASLVGAAFFAVHPLHTEAVTGIVGRSELLMGLGVLLSLAWYIKGRRRDHFEFRYIIASLGAFAVALLSKEQALMLPFLLVLFDLSRWRVEGFSNGMARRTVFRYLGFFLLLGAYLVVREVVLRKSAFQFSGEIAFLDNPLAHVGPVARVLTALKVAGKYLWLFVWPVSLSPDYSYNAVPITYSLWDMKVIISVFVWGTLAGLAAWSCFKRSGRVFFAVGFMVLTFLPASNLIVPIGTIMGERLFYLPSAGLCLLIAAGWDKITAWSGEMGRPRLVWLFGSAVFGLLLMLTLRTVQRNRDWRSQESLFRSAVQVVPQSAKIRYNLAVIHLDKTDEALGEIEKAFRIYPEYRFVFAPPSLSYGILLLKKGRIEEAVESLNRAVILQPAIESGYYNLALAHTRQGEWYEAEQAFRKAIALDPTGYDAYNNLSFVLWKQNRYQEALEAADEAIQLKPIAFEAEYNRAKALDALSRFVEAKAAYRKTLELKPLPSVARRLAELEQIAR